MRKRIYILLLFSIFIAAFTCVFNKNREVGVVASQDIGEDNSIFYIDNKNVLYHIDYTGKILMQKNLPSKREEYTLNYKNVSCGENGEVYILVEALSSDGKVKQQWIEKRDERGKNIGVIENLRFPLEEKRIYTIQTVGKELAVFSFDKSKQFLYLDLYSLSNGEIVSREYEFEKPVNMWWIKYTPKGSVYYIDDNYDIYCLDNRTLGKYNYEILPDEQGLGEGLFDMISCDEKGLVYFCDVYQMRFLCYDEAKDEVTVKYNKNEEINEELTYLELANVRYKEDKVFALLNTFVTQKDGFYIQDNEKDYIIDGLYYNLRDILFYFTIVTIQSFLFLMVVSWFLLRIRRARSILVKQLSVMVVVLLVSMRGIEIFAGAVFLVFMEHEAYEQAYILSKNIAMQIDGDTLDSYSLPLEQDNELFDTLSKRLHLDKDEFYETLTGTIPQHMYYNIYITRKGEDFLIFETDTKGEENARGLSRYYTDATMFLKESYTSENNHIRLEKSEEDGGESLYCEYVIKNSNGNVVGKAEVGVEYDYFYATIQGVTRIFFYLFAITIMIVIVVLIFQTKRNLKGLKKLRQGVLEIAEANWNTVVDVNSRDEIEDIANAFNRMTREIGSYLKSIEEMNIAYEKFVPKETLSILGKKSVSDMFLGDHVYETMTVLTVSVGNFYKLNETMTSEETFAFMNHIYSSIAASTIRFGGMIENYGETGVRVLYRQNAEYSIDSALKMLEKIYIEDKDIQMHAMIQKGNIMYGIAGTEKKAEAVAVSEILNYTYMLREVVEENHIPLVITAPVYKSIIDPFKYHIRYLGRIRSKITKNVFLDLYDVIDAYPFEIKTARLQTKEYFEAGVKYFIAGELKEARKAFIDVVRMDKSDIISQNYIFLCDRFIADFPETWGGYFR